jgi:hypothetical protein
MFELLAHEQIAKERQTADTRIFIIYASRQADFTIHSARQKKAYNRANIGEVNKMDFYFLLFSLFFPRIVLLAALFLQPEAYPANSVPQWADILLGVFMPRISDLDLHLPEHGLRQRLVHRPSCSSHIGVFWRQPGNREAQKAYGSCRLI